MSSPTARSLAECRKRGWEAQVVEKFNSFTKRRIDLFGCIDIVACTPEGILGIQATSNNTSGHHTERIRKINAEPRMKAWATSGGRIAVWSWAKRGAEGKRKRWVLREEAVTL